MLKRGKTVLIPYVQEVSQGVIKYAMTYGINIVCEVVCSAYDGRQEPPVICAKHDEPILD